jgi:hypothetical protein
MNGIKEGDMVMAGHEDEIHVGRVVHVMRDGMLGFPGSEYSIVASPEDPALLMQLFEMEDGALEETEYFIGHKSSEVKLMPSLEDNTGMDKALKEAKELTSILKQMMEEIPGGTPQEQEVTSEGYKDCGCETCKALNCDCPDCPACSPNNVNDGKDAEFEETKPNTDEYDNSVGKSYHTIWGGSVLDLNPFYQK